MTIPAFFLPQAFGFATLRVGDQAFKFRFVAGIDEEGGVIRRAEVGRLATERAGEEAEEEGI
ncbi:MAG: hypothetical protein IPK21_24715 [Haliscomenobacter sp.]|nr:hypothetical protein [Haliscomenobacter sp.]